MGEVAAFKMLTKGGVLRRLNRCQLYFLQYIQFDNILMNGCFHLNGNEKKKLQIFAVDYIFLKLFSSSDFQSKYLL